DLDRARPTQGAIAELLEQLAPGQGAAPVAPALAPAVVESPAGDGLRVLTFVSRDHGGAGTGTMRRVEALRERGADARVCTLVKRSREPFVTAAIPETGTPSHDPEAVWHKVRELAIEPARTVPGYRAQELFSL